MWPRVCLATALLSCAGAGASSPLQDLVRTNYSDGRPGLWVCTDLRSRYENAAQVFEFDSPGLERISCVAEEELDSKVPTGGSAAKDFAENDVYFVLLSGSADSLFSYKCKFCASKWVALERNPLSQRPDAQCGGYGRIQLPPGGHPLAGARHARVDGVRCHPAYHKGCDRGYAWCDGACCRLDALFYYPQLQRTLGDGGRLLTAQSAGPKEVSLLRLLPLPRPPAVKGRRADGAGAGPKEVSLLRLLPLPRPPAVKGRRAAEGGGAASPRPQAI